MWYLYRASQQVLLRSIYLLFTVAMETSIKAPKEKNPAAWKQFPTLPFSSPPLALARQSMCLYFVHSDTVSSRSDTEEEDEMMHPIRAIRWKWNNKIFLCKDEKKKPLRAMRSQIYLPLKKESLFTSVSTKLKAFAILNENPFTYSPHHYKTLGSTRPLSLCIWSLAGISGANFSPHI